MARFFPVIESPAEADSFWLELPERPWPAFIELSENAPFGHVALVLLQLSTYGHGQEGELSAEKLSEHFPAIAPGGLAVDDKDVTIFPSCCCGLESWRSWYRLLTHGESPWMGHDPSPWVERDGESFTVWTDGGLDESKHDSAKRVVLTRDELVAGLARAEAALNGFTVRLEQELVTCGIKEGHGIAEGFRSRFILISRAEP